MDLTLAAPTQAPPAPFVELAQQQLAGIDAWNAARAALERTITASARSREDLVDARRRLEGLRRQHQALVERTDEHLRGSADLLRTSVPVRAVLAHRNAWFRDRVADCLEAQGLSVVARLDDGADALGVTVAEQPDLLLVEDALPTVRGEDVVREARALCGRAVVVAQVGYDDGVATMLEAGATAAWARRVPPAEVAQHAAELVLTS